MIDSAVEPSDKMLWPNLLRKNSSGKTNMNPFGTSYKFPKVHRANKIKERADIAVSYFGVGSNDVHFQFSTRSSPSRGTPGSISAFGSFPIKIWLLCHSILHFPLPWFQKIPIKRFIDSVFIDTWTGKVKTFQVAIINV